VAIVERADQGFGRILAALEKQGLARNTLVMFTNDNGGEWLSRNAPLFHRKQTLWEGGTRVPLLMRWPGQIPAGRTTRQVGYIFDLTATILAVAGATVPPEARLDGMNLLPMVTGNGADVERTLFWRVATAARNQRSVRQGDWKVLIESGNVLLFNVRDDPGERNDLAQARQDIVKRMYPLIAAWEKDVDADGGGVGVTTPGRAGGAGRGAAAGRGNQPQK
jgi:arylsulfatase A-like enzyme